MYHTGKKHYIRYGRFILPLGRIDGQAKIKKRTLPICHDFVHDDHGKTERGRYSQLDSRMSKISRRTICGHSEIETEKHAVSLYLFAGLKRRSLTRRNWWGGW